MQRNLKFAVLYAVLYAKYAEVYILHILHLCALRATPHVADGDSPDQNGRADVQLEPDLRVCRFRVPVKDSDAVMTLRPYWTRHGRARAGGNRMTD